MERLFGGFMRVQRGLDEIPHLLETYHAFKNNPSGLSAQDRIRLLDFPPLSVQDEIIAGVSTLTKHELLKRAGKSLKELTCDELSLLYHRYWTDITCKEADAYFDALEALEEVSMEYCDEISERLRRFQKPLYEENEVEAIENAISESLERQREMSRSYRQNDLDVVFRNGKPWLRQLWDEDQGQKYWGFAMFENPQFANHDRRGSYATEQHKVLHWSLQALGAGFNLWQVESPNWPTQTTPTGEESFPPPKEQPPYPRDEIDPIYGRAPSNDGPWGHYLSSGALRNVFLCLDHESTTSVLHSHGLVDRMWIWAVDPDYEPSNNIISGYQGYLRVRLQQLVDNFYTARRWHADELSMEDLWKATQRDPSNGAFISVNEEEIVSTESSLNTGSRIGEPMRVLEIRNA